MAYDDNKPKVYLETTFLFYLTGRETDDVKVATNQAYTRKWWTEEKPSCHVTSLLRVATWRTFAMENDNEIIRGIRETRHAFAAKYDFDPRKISEAAGRIVRECGFKVVPLSVSPNFHYPEEC